MLNILKKINKKQDALTSNAGVTVAFLGDSVTQGCFEVYRLSPEAIQTVFDSKYAYHKYFSEIFSYLYPSVPVNIINAGISGVTASHSLKMIDDLVIKHNPDLVVVCFGLNDSGKGEDGLKEYIDSLEGIFERIKETGSDIIFMTPNMKCTHISCHINDDMLEDAAKISADSQNNGVFDKYIDEAIKLCERKNVIVCDCYKKWKKMHECGVDVTELLSNKINHPTREMNWLFAYSLVETIFNS